MGFIKSTKVNKDGYFLCNFFKKSFGFVAMSNDKPLCVYANINTTFYQVIYQRDTCIILIVMV